MALIDGASPRFRAPRPGWQITPIGESADATSGHADSVAEQTDPTYGPAEPSLRRAGAVSGRADPISGRTIPAPDPALRRTIPTGNVGILDLRVGYCRGPESKTVAEAAVAIDERERAGDPMATKGDLRSSLVPVVLVDGEPAAAGWGRIQLTLAAGRHLVEVQSQHSRTWRACEIETGRTTKLDYIGMLGDQHRAYGTGPDATSTGDAGAPSGTARRANRDFRPGAGGSSAVRGIHAGYTGHTLGPRGRLDFWQYLPANARGRRSFHLVLLALVIGVVLSLVLTSFGVAVAVALLSGAAIWIVALVGWAVRVLWTFLQYNRGEPEAALKTPEALLQVPRSDPRTEFRSDPRPELRLDAQPGSRPALRSDEGPGPRSDADPRTIRPAILDSAGPLPELGFGAAAILIDARFIKADLTSEELALQLPQGQSRINGPQRRALDDLGEVVPIRHRFAVPPPQIELGPAVVGGAAASSVVETSVDTASGAGPAAASASADPPASALARADAGVGTPVAATWTRMWIEVPPGSHCLTVRTPASPLPLHTSRGPADPPDSRSATVNLEAGQVARVDLTVSVTAVPDPAEPLLHRWLCRINRLGPAPTSDTPPAPKADVRGGLRRALTGRYWERPDR